MFGFLSFRLEFHLPHLVLRETIPLSEVSSDKSLRETERPFADSSFLNLRTSSGKFSAHSIHQAHDSLVISGTSNLEWTGFVISNKGYDDPTRDEEEDDMNKMERECWLSFEYGFFYSTVQGSQLWDAREYWLRIVAIRCRLASHKWEYLVRTVEEGIEVWVSFSAKDESFAVADWIRDRATLAV